MISSLQIFLTAIILASAFPAGYFLAYLCRDELVNGRKWFKGISAICLISVILLLVFYRNFPAILTMAYISIVSLISVHKSFDRKFVKNV